MDPKTLATYSEQASSFSEEWLGQPSPTDIYDLVSKFFVRGGQTVDVGCGNGRDTQWLNENGFPASGFDAVENLLQQARNLYPSITFGNAQLPFLEEIKDRFDNVFCETVIMHLPTEELPNSIKRLKSLLKVNGVIYLSWRVTEDKDQRDAKGRLYSAFEPKLILDQFSQEEILHFEDKISKSSVKRVCRLIATVPKL